MSQPGISQPGIKAPPFVRYVVYFNGQNAYAEVMPNPVFYNNPLTVIAWFAIINNPSSWAGIVTISPYTSENWWMVTGPSPNCSVDIGAAFTGGKRDIYLPPTACGEVHQYALRLSGNELSAFMDGKLYQTVTGEGEYHTFYTVLPLTIGARPHPPNLFSNVAVWQVLVYNRALSDAEIAQLYSNPTNPIRDGLVLWLQADPAYIHGNTWVDLSGHGNNATLYNTQLIQLAPSIPWFWVGVGTATAVAVGAGLWIAHSKGLI
jgi:hypothetical protein